MKLAVRRMGDGRRMEVGAGMIVVVRRCSGVIFAAH